MFRALIIEFHFILFYKQCFELTSGQFGCCHHRLWLLRHIMLARYGQSLLALWTLVLQRLRVARGKSLLIRRLATQNQDQHTFTVYYIQYFPVVDMPALEVLATRVHDLLFSCPRICGQRAIIPRKSYLLLRPRPFTHTLAAVLDVNYEPIFKRWK